MSSIDPVESLLAVVGLQPFITKKLDKVTAVQMHEAADYNKLVSKLSKEVVSGEFARRMPAVGINYQKMLTDLSEKATDAELQEMLSKFPMQLHHLIGELAAKVQQMLDFLRGIFPVQTRTTILEETNILPSALAIQKFAVLFDVLDSPIRVFNHIANGSLLTSQAQVVRQLYPTIAKAIDDSLTESMDREKTQSKSFRLPVLVNIGIGKFRGLQSVPVDLQQRMQANFAQAKQQQGKPSPPAGQGVNSVAAKESLTNTQRASFPAQTSKG
jgi:hypothetical protein